MTGSTRHRQDGDDDLTPPRTSGHVAEGPGGARPKRLRPLRGSEVLVRLLYFIELPGPDGTPSTYTVEIDSATEWKARLYVDGVERDKADMPARLPVPGGTIEVDCSLYGVRRVHLVRDSGEETRLSPVPGTIEDRRGRLTRRYPRLSRAIGWLAIAVLVVNLVLAVPQALDLITHLDGIAWRFGSFDSPITLPAWLNTTLILGGVLAAVERSLTLRSNRVLDFETLWTGL